MRKTLKIFKLREEQNFHGHIRYILADAGYFSSLEFEYIGDAEDQLKDNVLFDEKYVILEVYSTGKNSGEDYDR